MVFWLEDPGLRPRRNPGLRAATPLGLGDFAVCWGIERRWGLLGSNYRTNLVVSCELLSHFPLYKPNRLG